MAEINRQDLISDDALAAPLILAKNMEAAVSQLMSIKEASIQFNKSIQSSDSLKKAGDETQKLVTVNKELSKVSEQIAKEIVKQNTDYIQLQKTLQANREETKKRIALGNEDAKTVSKQNASIVQLEAALRANRAEYAKFATEQQRASKEGQDLLKTIQQQDADVKELRKSMGQAQANVGNYEDAFKNLKDELKLARSEMVAAAQQFGTGSKEFQTASERAGSLKDEIGDLQKSINNLSGSKIENLSSTFKDSFSKIAKGDLTGALESARQFATVSRSITFAEAGKSLKDFGSTMATLGRAILTNPIFLIGALVAGIVAAMYKFRDSIVPVKIAMDVLGKTFDFITDKLKEFTDWLGLTTFEQDKKAKATEEAAAREVEAVKKNYDTQIRLAEAAGKDISALEIKKQEAIIAASKKALSALIKSDEEYTEKSKALKEEIENAEIELQVLRIRENKKANDLIIAQRKAAEEKAANERLISRGKDFKEEREISTKSVKDIGQEEINISKSFKDQDASNRKRIGEIINEIEKEQSDFRKELSIQELEEKRQRNLEYANGAQSILNAYADNVRMQSEEEIANIEAQREYELQLAGDNKAAQDAINKKFDSQLKKTQKEQAEREKKIALFNIALNTAKAVTAALPNIPLSIIIGVIGGIQLATAAGIKLPAFKKGTDNAPGGLAIVGEEGSELIKSPDGKYSLTPSSASLMNLSAGSKVFTHDETLRILAAESLNNNRVGTIKAFDGYNFERLEKRFSSLEETIKKKKEVHINVTRRGLETMMKNADTRTWFLDNIYG